VQLVTGAKFARRRAAPERRAATYGAFAPRPPTPDEREGMCVLRAAAPVGSTIPCASCGKLMWASDMRAHFRDGRS